MVIWGWGHMCKRFFYFGFFFPCIHFLFVLAGEEVLNVKEHP